MHETYDDRLKESLAKAPNKLAAKLRKAALMHRHTVATQDFQ